MFSIKIPHNLSNFTQSINYQWIMLQTTSNYSTSIHQFRNYQSHEIQIFDLNSFNCSLQIIKQIQKIFFLLVKWDCLHKLTVRRNKMRPHTLWKMEIQACVHESHIDVVWECLNIINKILIHLKHPIYVKWEKKSTT